MIKIRAILGTTFVLSRDRLEQVQEIFRLSFPALAGYAEKIPSLLRDPVGHGYQSVLLLAEGAVGRIDAFALLLHFAHEQCCFLDFIAVRPGLRGSGIGGAIYEAAREYCLQAGAKGLYLEVEPDDPALTKHPDELRQSRQRVRFYEQYGARVIDGTDYAEPVGDPPTVALLIYDGLGSNQPLRAGVARRAVEMILTRRFGNVTSPEYVRRVVESFRDDPVRFRPLRYTRKEEPDGTVVSKRLRGAYVMVLSPKHEIHHVRERGYFERPIRVEAILEGTAALGLFTRMQPREHGEKPILAVHDADFVHYLQTVCSKLKEGRPVYPDTFPIRRPDRRPKELPAQAGYYCLDTGTPLYRNGYVAARASANCALTAAEEILSGHPLAYAVCRPPGHHAGRRFFGGFCYFNNAAIAAQYLLADARPAILDLDYHHGNGQQDIFYDRGDVMTISVHGHPDYAYPYFSGFEYETGSGPGLGFNRNFPLPPKTDAQKYLRAFHRAVELAEQFKPDVIIVCLGFDTIKGDPTGLFMLPPSLMRDLGRRLAAAKIPLLVVQEGGYNVRNIRRASAEFFRGCSGV